MAKIIAVSEPLTFKGIGASSMDVDKDGYEVFFDGKKVGTMKREYECGQWTCTIPICKINIKGYQRLLVFNEAAKLFKDDYNEKREALVQQGLIL
jgi:hypothetical protein